MAQLDDDLHDAYAPLIPVPAERRVLGGLDAFSLWFSRLPELADGGVTVRRLEILAAPGR